MNAMFDVVCSVAIGGIVLVMLVGFNGNIVESAGAQTIRVMAQTHMTEVTNILDYEFRKLGYRVSSAPDSAILYADSLKMRFKGDIDNNGVMDTITYFFDTTASGHANKNTHIFYRTLNSQKPQKINLGITRMRFWYYDASGAVITTNPLAFPSVIRSFKVAVNIESIEPYKETSMPYLKLNPGVYWERTFRPQNLR
jgi:hypothetical protein